MVLVTVQPSTGDEGNVSVLLNIPTAEPDPVPEEPDVSEVGGDKGGSKDEIHTPMVVSKALDVNSVDDSSQSGPVEVLQASQTSQALDNSHSAWFPWQCQK